MKPLILILLLFLSVFIGCGVKEESKLSTDVNALAKNLNLETKPIATQWKFTQIGDDLLGPADYTIIAVLKYNHAEWLSLYNKHKELEPINTNYISKDILEDRFPASVKACFKDEGANLSLIRNTYEVDAFARGAFIHGFCFFTDKDEVFVYTYTM